MSDSANPQPKNNPASEDPAVALIRAKLNNLYHAEPDAKQEAQEAEVVRGPLSKHQQFIHDLNHSGRSLADIQTAWHQYYAALPDDEKHEVWQEFYRAHEQTSHYVRQQTHAAPHQPEAPEAKPATIAAPVATDPQTEAELKQQILKTVRTRGKRKLTKKQHAKSLLFGLSAGAVMVFIVMFTFFNEQFITPFITPSTRVSATPIIVDPSNNNVSGPPEVIIPKINVEIPVLYDVASIDDKSIQQGLSEAVVHYPTTPNPGQLGNGVIFGHSSSNIFDAGRAKFAFIQLHKLENGDTFYLNKDGKQYVYQVISKQIVPPTDLDVLTDTHGKAATFTLITCDPPGFNVNRMVVTGEQISPTPSADQKGTPLIASSQTPAILPSNSESLWHRFTTWLSH